jgi:hypothetical protein
VIWQCRDTGIGAIAQLGERVLCKHEVVGSIPSGSTIFYGAGDSASRSRPPARTWCTGRSRGPANAFVMFEETTVYALSLARA